MNNLRVHWYLANCDCVLVKCEWVGFLSPICVYALTQFDIKAGENNGYSIMKWFFSVNVIDGFDCKIIMASISPSATRTSTHKHAHSYYWWFNKPHRCALLSLLLRLKRLQCMPSCFSCSLSIQIYICHAKLSSYTSIQSTKLSLPLYPFPSMSAMQIFRCARLMLIWFKPLSGFTFYAYDAWIDADNYQ